ncbi:MAG: dicarboxylate/amino acid:cation symporter [Holosporales bacterium]|jgi:Na+/H+-dicarboxylate symporter|nr:dicarboxylate/amino acid:cation symporter [Holosporales bacterium]
MSTSCCGISSAKRKMLYFSIAIFLGIVCGLSGISILEQGGQICSEIFIRIFKCVSMPVISLSVIIALSNYRSDASVSRIWKKTITYTICTTIAAASISAILYILISPSNFDLKFEEQSHQVASNSHGYIKYFLEIIPESIFSSFSEHKVLSVLLISVIFGFAIRFIQDESAKNSVISFFNGMHSIFFTITKFLVKILPIGLFGFITVSIIEFRSGMNIGSMGQYFMVIILANIVQGTIILPLWLMSKNIDPIKTFKAMAPALSVAFFSKSSSGTLPVTIEAAETNLKIKPEVSRFVLPLCTTINMNGCAAFIFTTVIYVMQNYGIEITPITIMSWIIIATIAAIGNAGVPMGCFFLSTSLLSSMDVPIPVLGIILPFYGVIDMLETSLNVWSDSCVATVVDRGNISKEGS